MKVKLFNGASGCYASITSGSSTESTWQGLDILLPAGKSPGAGLRERAEEFRAKAERYARYAELCDYASDNWDVLK